MDARTQWKAKQAINQSMTHITLDCTSVKIEQKVSRKTEGTVDEPSEKVEGKETMQLYDVRVCIFDDWIRRALD